MPEKNDNLSTPFLSIRDASRVTGLSQGFLRQGCRNATVPHIRSGKKYLINMPRLLRQLGLEGGDAD